MDNTLTIHLTPYARFKICLGSEVRTIDMLKMTEVYYYNNKRELQKLGLYNISSSEFFRKQQNSSFEILCMIENGSIIFTSLAFRIIEDDITMLLGDLIHQPNWQAN
jgi:hypothetical protein